MIYDKLKNIENYKGINKNLDLAIEYLVSHDLFDLPKGKTEIYGGDVYINKMDVNLKEEADGVYEFHRKYLDIHIDLDGQEKVLFCEQENAEIEEEYREEGDCGLIKSEKTAECICDTDHFVICMIEEPHMPCVMDSNGGNSDILKIVIKIKIFE